MIYPGLVVSYVRAMTSNPALRRWKVHPGAACIPLALLVCLGCESDSRAVDSGEAEEGVWWELASSPSLQIGGVGGEGPEALHRVRQGMVLSDGQIVLALRDEILLFSEGGEFQQYVGRAGEGPGEYRSISSMARLSDSDSFRVFDNGNLKISTLTRDDGIVDTELLDPEAFLLGTAAVAQPDGSVLSFARQSLLDRLSGAMRPVRPGPGFDSIVLVRMAGADLDTISIRQSGLHITSRNGNWTFAQTPPLGQELFTGLGPGIVAQGFNDKREFRLLGLDGTEYGVAKVRAREREVNDSIWSAAGREFLRKLGRYSIS